MGNGSRMRVGRWVAAGAVVAIIGVWKAVSKQYGWEGDRDAALQVLKEMSDRLGMWAIPAYVGLHTLTLALCLPYAVFLEAGASLLFGFLPAVLCVFSAKVLAASLSFWIGRFIVQIITFNLQQTITHPSIPHVDGINNPPTNLGNTQFGVALVYPPSIPLVGLFILPAIVVFGRLNWR